MNLAGVQAKHRKSLGLVIAFVCAIIFGLWPTGARGSYANGVNYVFLLVFTTCLRASSLVIFCLLTRKKLFQTKFNLKEGIVSGFFQFITIIGIYKALEFLPGPLVIIILFSHSLMLLFFMAWRKEIKLTIITVATTMVALGGLSVALDLWHPQDVKNIMGFIFSFVAAIAAMGRLYVWNHLTKVYHPIVIGAECFTFAALFSLLVLLFDAPHLPINILGWEYVWLGGIALVIGSFGMFYGISLLGSFEWSLFSKLEPVFTSIFSALLLHEILKPSQYGGILIVAGSLITYQVFSKRKMPPAPDAGE
jgi:drug/metabolite transporter (DMT)-like permease